MFDAWAAINTAQTAIFASPEVIFAALMVASAASTANIVPKIAVYIILTTFVPLKTILDNFVKILSSQ